MLDHLRPTGNGRIHYPLLSIVMFVTTFRLCAILICFCRLPS